MPREENGKVCNLNDTDCMVGTFKKVVNDMQMCQCLDPCNDINYSIEYDKTSDFDYHSGAFIRKAKERLDSEG